MLTVLLVDDSPTVLLAMRQAIRHAKGPDVSVLEARHAAAALEAFQDAAPDVVFLDLMMPDPKPRVEAEADEDAPTAGLRLMRDIVDRRPQTQVIVTTGLPPNHPDVIEAVSLGAVGVLRKPVRPEDVRATLDALKPDTDLLSYFG